MDEVKKKYNSIDWIGLKRSAGKLKAKAASGFKDMVMTDVENNVRAATSDTSWGATGAELENIARSTFNREEYPLVMGIVWERLSARKWRNVYKSLDLLKYLCLHGSQRCYDEAKDALPHIQALQGFRYVDSAGKDEGRNVRERAKQLAELLADPELMEEERQKSKALKAKIGGGVSAGVSSDDYRYGAGPADRGYGGREGYDEYNDSYQNRIEGGDGYGGYQNNYGYGEDDEYEQRFDDEQPEALPPATSVNPLDDLLGLGAPEAPPPLPQSDSKVGGSSALDDDFFDPRGAGRSSGNPAPSAQQDAFSGFNDDLLGALPSTTAPAAPAKNSNPSLDIFGDVGSSVPAQPAKSSNTAAAGSGFDFFGSSSAAPATSTSAAPAPAAYTKPPAAAPNAQKSAGVDIFGDLVNLDNMGQASRQEKHNVHSGNTINSLTGSGSSKPAASGSSSKTDFDHDPLFGL
uniref:ENTH domain-containing protein n=1 Tax=Rhodosorus marinus TaxID=101924 RepID=A0A7S2ZQV2_9RHOD|mmetsp:Transcript_28957/g.112672  ORF Transcript_28957/g.112672 Transcript_28957/m.112672 type:complete len:462 (+) Transcript_28957:128-1513(+)|eukprot:CAMPEP_0113959510 /NCGR_PEP_ID=MMETSP0011_2-20120614/4184_1 /TAXON_ID=101924 /ORGANISM="Rhodosorus marinus" /LENGTH=461 /DNA_ID=CAMNT_0000970829 /DNA_START=86 /DNA_END=1471 /DNA_ORIENTATION=- /assembly_acc=CAM_ASM_000156